MTSLPISGEPVKKLWSNGSASRASATLASPSKMATSDSSNTARTIFTNTADSFGAISEVLIITVLPQAMAGTSGPNVRVSG